MTITAKVIAHSRAKESPDLFTLECRYPRFIHAEAKTHRVIKIDDAEVEFLQEISLMDDEHLSRNASSSRAIPIERMIRDVMEDPAMPVAWGSNKPGMQAGDEINTPVLLPHLDAWSYGESDLAAYDPQDAWLEARDLAVRTARGFAAAGYHKQVVNRLLEPFGHITVVVTATEWSNFFKLRRHPDADPTMRALANAMWDAIAGSEPNQGRWHLPYVGWSEQEWANEEAEKSSDFKMFETLAMISAARCARVSYLTHSGEHPKIENDLALSAKLQQSKHASPFEHQAQADPEHLRQYEHGNFTGWVQHRKVLGL